MTKHSTLAAVFIGLIIALGLTVLACGDGEKTDWEEAEAADTISSYLTYLDSYPSGQFIEDARERIDWLRTDDSPFLAAQEQGSLEAYEEFLTEFFGHRREDDAHRAIDDINKDMQGQDLVDLVEQGKVEARSTGSGIDSVSLEVRRLVGHEVVVIVLAGTFFTSGGSAQDMVAIGDEVVYLADDSWHSATLPAACANLELDVPDSDVTFGIQRSAQHEELEMLMPVLSAAGAAYDVSQAAVWIVTDNADYGDLGTATLRTAFMLFGSRIIHEAEAGEAMRIVDEAGIDISSKAIWWDREEILQGLEEGVLKDWLRQRGG